MLTNRQTNTQTGTSENNTTLAAKVINKPKRQDENLKTVVNRNLRQAVT